MRIPTLLVSAQMPTLLLSCTQLAVTAPPVEFQIFPAPLQPQFRS